MSRPQRIQQRRTKGWRKPEGTIVVSRPSRWGNPYRVIPGKRTAQEAVDAYRAYVLTDDPHGLTGDQFVEMIRDSLGGRDLACWCPLDSPCHADVLLELANPPSEEA